MYDMKFISTRLYTTMKLILIKMEEGATLAQHIDSRIDSFNYIAVELVTINAPVDDESKTLYLLNSLPWSYEHLSQPIMYGKSKILYDKTIITLLAKDMHKKMRSTLIYTTCTTLSRTRIRFS